MQDIKQEKKQEPYNVYTLDRYIIYLRKSREDRNKEKQGAEETLKRHREILTAHAARAGLYVDKIYEEVVSGETIKERPEIQKVIEECYAGKYRGIIVVEVSRLSRGNQGDAQVILDCLKYGNQNQGLLVVTPTKVYDVAHNPDDEEYMEFELFMSRREYKMINKRLDRGRKQAVVEGQYMAAYRPYGYDIHETSYSRTLVPNPAEAPVVKMIFNWAANEMLSPGKIAQRLTNMGIPTYTGAREWGTATIRDILANPVHMGKVRWNDRMQVKTMVDGELVVSRPRSNHTPHFMLYDGQHQALVDEETFLSVRKRFGSDRTKANLKLMNPLAGLLVCQACGKAMVYQGNGYRQNTQPRLTHPSSQLCKVKSVAAPDVYNAVAHALKMYIEDFELKIDNRPTVDETSIPYQVEALEKELRKVKKKLDKAFDDYEDGVYTANEFVERKAVHTAKIESIKGQIEMLERTIPEKLDYQEKIRLFSQCLEAFLDPEVPADSKNEFLKGIISKIEFSRENNDEFILDVHLR